MGTDISNNELKVEVSNKQILSLALPISLAILIPQLNMLINSIFLGQLSQEALGNAGITGVFYLIFAVSGHGLNNSMQSVLSKYAGAGKPENFNPIIAQGVRLSLQMSILFILFTCFLAPFILENYTDPASYPSEMNFLRIRIFGLPFLYLFQLGNAMLVATLNSRWLIIGFLIEASVNVVFDYLLIFGKAGFPAMGFNGAALASVIAECMGMIVVFGVLVYTGLKKKYALFSSFRFNKDLNSEILKIAIPLVFQFIISLTTWLIFFILIETKGIMAKAISNTMRNVFGLAGIFIWAFAGTSNTMVANLIGQGKENSVIPAIKRISFWSLGLCILLISILNIYPQLFFRLFDQNEAFIEAGIPVIRVVSLGMIFMSVSNIWLNGVTGTGKTRINLMIEIFAVLLYLTYTYYVMHYNYTSLAKAWSNEFVYWLSIFLFSFIFLNSGKWKKSRL